jgi:hypothetical protein
MLLWGAIIALSILWLAGWLTGVGGVAIHLLLVGVSLLLFVAWLRATPETLDPFQ